MKGLLQTLAYFALKIASNGSSIPSWDTPFSATSRRASKRGQIKFHRSTIPLPLGHRVMLDDASVDVIFRGHPSVHGFSHKAEACNRRLYVLPIGCCLHVQAFRRSLNTDCSIAATIISFSYTGLLLSRKLKDAPPPLPSNEIHRGKLLPTLMGHSSEFL